MERPSPSDWNGRERVFGKWGGPYTSSQDGERTYGSVMFLILFTIKREGGGKGKKSHFTQALKRIWPASQSWVKRGRRGKKIDGNLMRQVYFLETEENGRRKGKKSERQF